jgi:hypothetical protein
MTMLGGGQPQFAPQFAPQFPQTQQQAWAPQQQQQPPPPQQQQYGSPGGGFTGAAPDASMGFSKSGAGV